MLSLDESLTGDCGSIECGDETVHFGKINLVNFSIEIEEKLFEQNFGHKATPISTYDELLF